MRFRDALCPVQSCRQEITPDYKTPEGDDPYYLVGREYACLEGHVLRCDEDDNGMIFVPMDPDEEVLA